MKKNVAFLLVLCAVFALAACGQQQPVQVIVQMPEAQTAVSEAEQSSSDSYSSDDLLAMAQAAERNSRDYTTVSTTGIALELPYANEYLDQPFRTQVKFTEKGAIYIMPKPKQGNGVLGTITAGTEVTILAEYKGFYFFVADDGRMGWNGKNLF